MTESDFRTPPPVTCIDVTGGNQPECVSTSVAISSISGPLMAKIPVTLTELTVQVNVDSVITLPEPALEIKDIKKRLKITQCLLLQPTNGLFIKGFVRKNIAYATRSCSNKEGVCGDIRHCTVDVPFSCTTTIDSFANDPINPMPNSSSEFEYFKRQDLPHRKFAEKDQLLSGDFSEFNQVSEEFFTELPYCELTSSRIVEFDEFLNRRRPADSALPFEEREFRKIEEKMVLFITLKVLQNQQVLIPSPVPIEPCGVAAESGGFEVKITQHSMGSTPGMVRLCYNMLQQPDKIEITHNGNIVATTGGFVSGTGSLEFFYDAIGDKFVVVTATGSASGTLWCYYIGCPGDDPPCDPANPPCDPFSSSSIPTKGDWKTDSEWLAANGDKVTGETD